MSWPFPLQQDPSGWPMQMFVVYDSPKDAKPGYPWVVRRWEIGPGLPESGLPREACCGRTLDDVRSLVPPGMALLARSANDDPCIREVWL